MSTQNEKYPISLKFMGPGITNVLPSITNKMQHYTVYLFLHSAPLLLPATVVAGSSKGLTNTQCCMYSCELLMMGGGTA